MLDPSIKRFLIEGVPYHGWYDTVNDSLFTQFFWVLSACRDYSRTRIPRGRPNYWTCQWTPGARCPASIENRNPEGNHICGAVVARPPSVSPRIDE